MMLEVVSEISVFEVYDRGVPNKERLLLQINEDIADTSQFCVVICNHVESGPQMGAYPINDHFFWLGSASVKKGDWIFLFTGSGTSSSNPFYQTTLYTLYWGRPNTIFARSNIVPMIIRFDAVKVHLPLDRPQYPALTK